MIGLGGSPGSSAPQSFKALLSEENTIPRNLTKVPKDQQRLLDRPDSWFTPHKGANGPPNVPAGVLESLKEFHAARTLPPPAQKPRAPVASVPSPTGQARPAVVHNFSDHEESSSSSSSSPPGTPVSWPSSPERPQPPANQPASPTLSIKSQIGIESQLPATAATADLPSSPPRFSSPSIPTPKRFDPPANFPQPTLKRRRIEEFPSSSGGFEDELETAIPNALFQATPPINRIAAHLLTRSEAVTSPPCGQGSMVPSSYNDGRMAFKSSTPKERRNMKIITFDSSPRAPTADPPPEATLDEMPTIPLSQPRENRVPASSGPCIASTYAADSHQSSQAPQLVHDTPGAPRTFDDVPGTGCFSISQAGPSDSKSEADLLETTITEEQKAGNPEEPEPMIIEEGVAEETTGVKTPAPRVSLNDPVRWKKEDDKRELIQWLNDNWVESDWLPPHLQHYRSTLSFSSLKTLQNITKLAIDGGVDLLSLWAEPDGCLYRTISKQTNGKLSFPEDLNHEALEPLAKASRLARERRATSTTKSPVAQHRSTVEPSAAPIRNQPNVGNEDSSTMLPEIAASPHLPREEVLESFTQQPAKAFQNAYPSFTGSVADFVRACIVVKGLQRKHQLPKWLYDDFIRAFVDDYTSYMDEVDKSSSVAKPMSAIRWYVANVDRPVYQKDIVTAENLDRIFEIYSEEVGEAKKWLLDGISSSPIVLETPQRPSAHVSMSSKHASPALPVASLPKDDAKSPLAGSSPTVIRSPAESLRSPKEVQPASEVVQAPTIREQTLPDSRDKASMPEPKLSISRQDKGKRDADEEPPRRGSPTTPTLRRENSSASGDDDLVFLSSNPRSRPTPVQTAGPEKIIKHESPTVHRTSPLGRSTPQKVPAINQTNGTLSQKRRTGTVAETPPPAPKTAAAFPGNEVTSGAGKTAVRRTLPASFDFGPPSRPAVSSPARSTLSASTQDARVKKPKKTEKEKQEAYRKKIAKLFKQGRLPGSTPAPKGGDA